MSRTTINIAIVDDHQIVIDGLKSLLMGDDRFIVVLECTNPLQLLEELNNITIDILITDVMMPEMSGADLAREVRRRFRDIKILVLSMSGQGDIVNKMIEEADIAGYAVKNIGQQELLLALDKIAAGGEYFNEEVIDAMTRADNLKKENEEANLSNREIEIIRLIEKELSNKQIADTLFLSERTVETHRKNIFRKTKTNSLIGLIKYAYEHGLIGTPSG